MPLAPVLPYLAFEPRFSAGLLQLGWGPAVGAVATVGVDWAPRLRLEGYATYVVDKIEDTTRGGVSGEAELAWPIPFRSDIRLGPAATWHGTWGFHSHTWEGSVGVGYGLVASLGPHDHSAARWELLLATEQGDFLECDCGYWTPRLRVHHVARDGLLIGGEAQFLRLSADIGWEFGLPSPPDDG